MNIPEKQSSPLKISLIATCVVAGVLFAASAVLWNQFPDNDQFPVHFGIDGQPNRYGSKIEALLYVPAMTLFIGIIFSLAPLLKGRSREEIAKCARWPFLTILGSFLLLMASVHALLLATYLHISVDISVCVLSLVSLQFIAMGLILQAVPYKHYMGINFCAKLESEEAWRKIHKAFGLSFAAAGAVCLVGVLLKNLVLTLACLIIGPILALIGASLLYSKYKNKNA